MIDLLLFGQFVQMLSGKTDRLRAWEAGLLSAQQLCNFSTHGMQELALGFDAGFIN